MNDVLLFIHFVGLMAGAAGGLGTAVAVWRSRSLPADQAQVLRGLGPVLANVSAIGLVLLWVTGLILVWSKWNGIGSLPGMFWVKFVFVLLLTAAVGAIHLTYSEIRRGHVAAAGRLPLLGPVSGLSALLSVLFAVIAFH